MKFKDSLYNIITKEEIPDIIRYKIELNPEHFIYKAHFPDLPITPGVCIVQIAQELIADYLGENLTLTKIKNAKFVAAISPKTDKIIMVDYKKIISEDNEVSVQCVMHNESSEKTYTKLSFSCKKQ